MQDMQEVSFTAMADGTEEDYELVAVDVLEDKAELPERLLATLRNLEQYKGVLRVNRLQHSLQSATRAYRDGRDEEYIVAALLHDIGDTLAPYSHGPLVAAVLTPFMSERMCWIIEKHPLFQAYYYAHYMGGDRHAKEKYKDHPFYADCEEFCEKYDQNCFDPEYDALPVEFFEDMVRRIFTREPSADGWWQA